MVYLGLRTLEPSIFDRRSGFYMKNHRQPQLKSSQIRNPGQTMVENGLKTILGLEVPDFECLDEENAQF